MSASRSSKNTSWCDLIHGGKYKPWVNCPMYSLNAQYSIGAILPNCWVSSLCQRCWVMIRCMQVCQPIYRAARVSYEIFLWGKAFHVIMVSVFWVGMHYVGTYASGWPSPRELIWVDYVNPYLLSVCLWLWSQSEARPPSSESGSPLRLQINHKLMPIFHSILPSLVNLFLFFFNAFLLLESCFLTWATIATLGRFPATFTLLFLDLGLVSECRHPCFIMIQHLMTVTSSDRHTLQPHTTLPLTAAS